MHACSHSPGNCRSMKGVEQGFHDTCQVKAHGYYARFSVPHLVGESGCCLRVAYAELNAWVRILPGPMADERQKA
eukprot:4522154-Lingulodinium_polyedra.AAC.1